MCVGFYAKNDVVISVINLNDYLLVVGDFGQTRLAWHGTASHTPPVLPLHNIMRSMHVCDFTSYILNRPRRRVGM